jgi:hypothetical protein
MWRDEPNYIISHFKNISIPDLPKNLRLSAYTYPHIIYDGGVFATTYTFLISIDTLPAMDKSLKLDVDDSNLHQPRIALFSLGIRNILTPILWVSAAISIMIATM